MPRDPAALLERLIACPTNNPGEVGAERALAALLAVELRVHQPDSLEIIDVSGEHAYVAARWGQPRVLINAHIDTVPVNAGWSSDPFVARRSGGKLYGLGSADTKGAIAAILCALDEARPRDTLIVFSGDEEVGGACMRAFLDAGGARGVERAVVCEPTSCRAGTRHRGIVTFTATVRGQGGHSSLADRLPAPLVELSRLALACHDWGASRREQGPPGFPGMCLNVAKLDGGVAFNVVPESATLTVSLRPPPGADAAAIRRELTALAGGAVVGFPLANPPFATRDVEWFRPLLGPIVDAPVDLGFWTEAALLAEQGIDAVVFGPGDIARAHAPDEYVPIADLETARAVFARLLAGVPP